MKQTTTVSLSILFLLAGASGALARSVCIVPSPNGINATVDCSFPNPTMWDNATVGYSVNAAPCQTGSCGFSPGRGGNAYRWSISASSTDPSVNSGPLPEPVASLYLWLSCSVSGGWFAVEFSFATDDPGFVVLGLNPLNGVLNAGNAVDPLLVVGGCPSAYFLAGEIVMLNLGPVSTEKPTWGGIKALYR
jgi:hypothetical protein